MRDFDSIFSIAVDRKGSVDAVEGLLDRPLSLKGLSETRDDRWLSCMAKSIFQAGFSWKVIDAKWQGFENAFFTFDPVRVLHFHDEDMDRLLADKGIVRNGAKIAATIHNARFICDLIDSHGSAGAFFANWPQDDFVGLLAEMRTRGARLGGATGQRVLRSMGKDSFLLSTDVCGRLIAEGVVDKPPTSKRDLAATQAAFNTWQVQSGRSFNEISRVLALSV